MIIETVTAKTAIHTESQLGLLESVADQHLTDFKRSYWLFVEAIQAIRLSGYWQADNLTWEQYLTTRWLPLLELKSTARIRQLEAAYPVMRIVADVTGVALSESQVRNLKAIVPLEDRYLLPEIVSRTHAYTSSPAKRHYEATYNVLKERQATASVTIDGQSYPVDIVTTAVNEAIEESDKRRNGHIADSGKWSTIARYEVGKDANIHVTGVTLQPNQQMIIIVRQLKEDSADEN